ncbi:MAG TPA: VanZ family protein, partial [Anaerolineales bacterium]
MDDFRGGTEPRHVRITGPTLPALLSLALLLHILAVAFGSLMPLALAESWTDVWNALQAALTLHVEEPIFATLSERLLTFLPMGVLAGLQMEQARRHRPLLAAASLTILVALAIEIFQATVVGRHPRLSDFILAALFGCMGSAISRAPQLMRHATSSSRRWWRHPSDSQSANPAIPNRSAAFWTLVLALVLCNVSVIGLLTITHSGLHIAGWNCSYPLLIGNESTLDRPWLGRIRGLAIYDRVPNDGELKKLARLAMTAQNSEVRRQVGALLIYAFDAAEGSRIPNIGLAGAKDDLDAMIAEPPVPTLANGVLDIDGSHLIRTRTAAKELCDRIMRSQSFAVEVDIASGNLNQTGPARIVSMSLDTLDRDFTLGQDHGALILRVRTPRNGPN